MLSSKIIRPLLHKIYDNVSLCRSVNTFTPLFGLNSAITGTFYKEPFPNTMRTMSTSPVNRDNDSASKDNEAGVCLSFGIYGMLVGLVVSNLVMNRAKNASPEINCSKWSFSVLHDT